MKCHVLVLGFILNLIGSNGFVIPDELPSLLSLVYSNIPVIKKGTDSRLGWGFRLGDRADFQVLVELGPQRYTQPLANQDDTNTSKRSSLESLANTLYAQRQQEKREKELAKQQQQQTLPEKEKPVETEGSKWLQNWSKEMQTPEPNDNLNELIKTLSKAKPGLAEGEIDAKSVIPEDEPTSSLVKKAAQATESKPVSTSTEGALDDVDLD